MYSSLKPLRALAVVSITVCALAANAQNPAPIVRHTYEDSDGGWTIMGTGGKISVTHDAANVKSGKAALQLDYSIKKGELAALLLATPDGMLTKAKSFRFAIKSDTGCVLAAILQEQGGGRYIAMFTVPSGIWQQVELAPSDFVLSEDGNDPPDPDGKLDLDKVEAFGLADVGQIFAQADNADLEGLFNIKRGAHTLFIDDLAISEDPLASSTAAGATDLLDTFARPQIGWFTVGGMKAALINGAPLAGRGIQLDYHQASGKPTGAIRKIPRGSIAGKTSFSVDIASARPAKLLLQVEEKTGGKYNVLVDVPGGKERKTISIPFSEFKAGDDSKDNNDHLDLDQVNQVLVMDVNALLGMADGDNTLWIGNVRATAAK